MAGTARQRLIGLGRRKASDGGGTSAPGTAPGTAPGAAPGTAPGTAPMAAPVDKAAGAGPAPPGRPVAAGASGESCSVTTGAPPRGPISTPRALTFCSTLEPSTALPTRKVRGGLPSTASVAQPALPPLPAAMTPNNWNRLCCATARGAWDSAEGEAGSGPSRRPRSERTTVATGAGWAWAGASGALPDKCKPQKTAAPATAAQMRKADVFASIGEL
jgi:hypothetical protein